METDHGGDVSSSDLVTEWRVRGSYFEGCNCDAICPCRAVRGVPGGLSTDGVCYGSLSWRIDEGHAGATDLAHLLVVLSFRYRDDVQPSTQWEVVAYIDDRADDAQHRALADIFLGRAGGTVASQYGALIGEVHAIRRARITLEHVAPQRRIHVAGYLTVESEGEASEPGEVQCGIPGMDHPGTELFGDTLVSTDEVFRWELRGRRNGSFATDFDYRANG